LCFLQKKKGGGGGTISKVKIQLAKIPRRKHNWQKIISKVKMQLIDKQR
jgi:hypothetical protein